MKNVIIFERALILAPNGRDGLIAANILGEAGIHADICASLPEVIQQLEIGAAFVIVTEEALVGADLAPLAKWLSDQPEWSDLPFVLLTVRGGGLERNPAAKRYLDLLGNVTFLERPFHPTTFVSVANSALRARRRQYEARARMQELEESEEHFRFLDLLAEKIRPLSGSDKIMEVTAYQLGNHLGASICAYADVKEDQDTLQVLGNWTAPGVPSLIGEYKLSAFGHIAASRLRAGQIFITNDALTDLGPKQAAPFIELGIRASIAVPLIKEGRLSALMAVHSDKPRQWSRYEINIVSDTIARSWAHVERGRSEEALRASENRFRAAVSAVNGLLWTNDALGRMVGEQPGWSALTGQTLEEYQGYGWANAVHPEDAQPTIDAWNEAVAQRKMFVFEHRLRCHDGEWRSFAIRGVPVVGERGEVREWVGVHTDVTEARHAEIALREEKQTLETLNQTGAAIASELDLERVVQLVTDAGLALVGAQFGAFFYNVLGENGDSYMLFTLSGAERSAFEGFGMPRATAVFRPTFVGESTVRSDDITKDARYGKNKPYKGMPKGHLPVRSYLAVPVTLRSGEVVGGLFFGHPEAGKFTERHEQLMKGIAAQAAVAMDNARLYQAVQRANDTLEQRVSQEVAERIKTEEVLRQSQKMEAIGQLTGGVAHDFNNLLTIIKSSTELLRRPGISEDKRKRYVDAISETVDRAARLTAQLLAFARRQVLKPEVFDVNERLFGVLEMLRTIVGSTIQIVTDIDCKDCFVKADVNQFETALINMTVNARDAMDGEGTLTIAVKALESMAVDINDPLVGSYAAVSLTDTGSGIPPDKIAQIFEPFFTTKKVGRGTGLGLSQVYGFAKQSGGDVKVESELNCGTTFTLYLPRIDAPEIHCDSQNNESTPSNADAGKVRRVLVVEDNSDIGKFATQLLRDLGYETSWARSGAEALEVLAGTNGFDVVFSDVVMPGMSGIDLGLEIRRLYPELPVVLTSGYSDVLAEEGRHGFELLQKPYAGEKLSDVLRRAVSKPQK